MTRAVNNHATAVNCYGHMKPIKKYRETINQKRRKERIKKVFNTNRKN
jgi:hypothetical protein